MSDQDIGREFLVGRRRAIGRFEESDRKVGGE